MCLLKCASCIVSFLTVQLRVHVTRVRGEAILSGVVFWFASCKMTISKRLATGYCCPDLAGNAWEVLPADPGVFKNKTREH